MRMRRDARDNRERIMAAAEAVFGERAAAGSTEDVARLAGVGIATVFRHFPTKDALVEATLLRHFERLVEQVRTLDEHPDPAAALRATVGLLIESGTTKLTLAGQLADRRGRVPPTVVAASRQLQSAVERILRRARDAGAVRPGVEIGEVYLLIRALAHASATMPTDPATLRRAVDLVLAGMAGPVTARRGSGTRSGSATAPSDRT